MKILLPAALAALCFTGLSLTALGSSEPTVPLKALTYVEGLINDKIRSNVADPYDILGTARGTYAEGYGAVFTVELNLVLTSPMIASPFRPALTEDELVKIHDRKVRKEAVLKDAMRGLMVSAGRSLTMMPPSERIVMEAFLFNYRWETSRGLSRRIVLSVGKQKLLDAVNRHADDKELEALIEEQDL